MKEVNDNRIIATLIPAALTLFGVIVGAFLNYHWGISGQLKIDDHRKRQQVFSELMGRKFLTTQLYVSHFEALINSDYHEAKWKLAGYPKDSIDLREAKRWMHKSEDLALDIAKNNQSLFETVGFIRILFPKTLKLSELINRIYHFKTPKILVHPFNLNATDLEAWPDKATKELQVVVETEYAKPIDDLLDYLSAEIDRLY